MQKEHEHRVSRLTRACAQSLPETDSVFQLTVLTIQVSGERTESTDSMAIIHFLNGLLGYRNDSSLLYLITGLEKPAGATASLPRAIWVHSNVPATFSAESRRHPLGALLNAALRLGLQHSPAFISADAISHRRC